MYVYGVCDGWQSKKHGYFYQGLTDFPPKISGGQTGEGEREREVLCSHSFTLISSLSLERHRERNKAMIWIGAIELKTLAVG